MSKVVTELPPGTATLPMLAKQLGAHPVSLYRSVKAEPSIAPLGLYRAQDGHGKPAAFYNIDAVTDWHQALRGDTKETPPPGMDTLPQIARALGIGYQGMLNASHRIGFPRRQGKCRPRGGRGKPAPYYDVNAVVRWCRQHMRILAPDDQQLLEQIAPQRAPHGGEYRAKTLECGCPVCRSGLRGRRAQERGTPDRATHAVDRLAYAALDPRTDLDAVTAKAAALATETRVRALRAIAAAYPLAVPWRVVLHLVPECAKADLAALRASGYATPSKGGWRYTGPGIDG